jgi:hypothetical protein
MERVHVERRQAQFQLKDRLKWAQVAHPNNALADGVDLSAVVDDEAEQDFTLNEHGRVSLTNDPQPPSTQLPLTQPTLTQLPLTQPTSTQPPLIQKSKRIRAQFCRRRTHNEQLIVAPCGMILARETFYGAEAVSTVAVRTLFVSLSLLIALS